MCVLMEDTHHGRFGLGRFPIQIMVRNRRSPNGFILKDRPEEYRDLMLRCIQNGMDSWVRAVELPTPMNRGEEASKC